MPKRKINNENERPNDDQDKESEFKKGKISGSNSKSILTDVSQNDSNEFDDDGECMSDEEEIESSNEDHDGEDGEDEYEDDEDENEDDEDENEDDEDENDKESVKKQKRKSKAKDKEHEDNERFDDIESEKIDLMRQLQLFIRNLKPSGSESIGGEATELPVHPVLFIKDFGHVPLPLNEVIAESLIKLSAKSPYGLNEKTLIDTKVRDSFQIEPSLIDIKNPDWNSNLHKLVERVAKGLGCHGKIEPKLYKLLIYRKGGHFKRHRDTEKDKNMFATMVLQLPSIHEGGELVIYHKNNKKDVYDFGQSTGKAPYTVNFVAHYADVEHEIREVKSGYRLALVDSLCWVDGNSNNVTKNSDMVDALSKSLDKLNDSCYKVAITLNHKYTPSALRKHGIKALKGIDNDRFNHLTNANAKLPPEKQLNFYVAHAELFVESYLINERDSYDEDDSRDWEENDKNKEIKEWYNVNGTPCFKNATIDIDFLTFIIDPDGETLLTDMNKSASYGENKNVEIDGYTGNEGVTKVTTYNKYLLFFWPKSYESSIFMSMDKHNVVDVFYNSLDSNYKDPEYIRNLTSVITKLIESKTKVYGDTSSKIISIIKKIKHLELFKKLISNTSNGDHPIKDLANLILIFEWDTIKEIMLKFLYPENDWYLQKNIELINELFKKDKKIAYECFKCALLPVLNDPDKYMKNEPRGCGADYDSKHRVYYGLIKTIFLFENEHIEELSEKYANLLILEGENCLRIFIDLLKKLSNKENYKNFLKPNLIVEKFDKYLIPKSLGQLIDNYHGVRALYNMNQIDISYECLKRIVVPVLDTPKLFMDNNKTYFSFNKKDILYDLADIILLFKSKNVNAIVDKYVDLVIKVIPEKDQNILKGLLDSFNQNQEYYCSVQPILRLYELYLNWLAPKIPKPIDKFTWSMPGSIPTLPKLDEFLRSERQQMIYSGSFNSINDARRFVAQHRENGNGYSLNMTSNGVGKNAHVVITKTKDYFEHELKIFNSFNNEYKKIENLLKTYKK